MIITTLRTYGADHTRGRLFVDGKLFGATLEDVARPDGVKIAGKTCIPEYTYFVVANQSTKFKKEMLQLFNDRAYLTVSVRGVSFSGIRAHDGVTIEHTEGCILVGDQVVDGKLQGRKAEELKELVKAAIARGETVYWVFSEDIE